MWAFLASDCMFFGMLIATYMVYKNRSIDGPYPQDVFDVPYTSVSAFVLLLSSLTMVLALAAIQHGQERRMRIWLTTTAILGCVFLGGQFYEFTTFVTKDGLTLSSNLFGSTFFMLTGFHGTHVAIGVFWLLSLVVALGARQAASGAVADRGDRRPVLALRRHRVDPDLHVRLSDPLMTGQGGMR